MASVIDNLPDRATAKRRTRVRDSIGGSKDSWATLFTDRTCWRQAASSGEIQVALARGVSVSHKVYFSADPGVDERDVLVVGGDTMSVRSAADPDATVGFGFLWRVMVLMET